MKELLLFARPPQPRRTSVDVGLLVSMTAELICLDPSLQGVQVDVTGAAPPIAADAEMLKIVFQNLLVNGAQAMRGDGRIRVAVQSVDGSCSIAFTDEGPGIPAELREKIFTAFFTTKARGTGLGLATAKRLIEAHRGDIQVACPQGGGTTFTVSLPMEPGEVGMMSAQHSAAHSSTS